MNPTPDSSPLDDPALADAQHPWLGLWSYTEAQRDWFRGRGGETEELLTLVRREPLTVLFGVSGLGKTSLLRAGLFPRLRERDAFPIWEMDGLPVYVRLDHGSSDLPAGDQILAALRREAQSIGAEVPEPLPGESLWEYFHRRAPDGTGFEAWSAGNRPLAPVLVLDQFEEMFTLGFGHLETGGEGAGRRERLHAFVADLACLVENRAPDAFRERLESDPAVAARYSFDPAPVRVVLSLREDFVADLEGLRPLIRLVATSRLRLLPLSGGQAREVIEQNGAGLIEPGVAEPLVRFVAARQRTWESAAVVAAGEDAAAAPLADLRVDPALLSVMLRELNNRRIEGGHGRITESLLHAAEQDILEQFFDRAFAGLPGAAILRHFVEDCLITATGWRNSCALDDALNREGMEPGGLDALVDRRILRYEDRLGHRHVELAHDVLAPLVRARRDDRQAREAREAAEAREREARERLAQRQALIDQARRNEGIGLLFRAEIAEERGRRYPETLFHAARAIGFAGVGRESGGEEAGEEDRFPILLHPERDARHHQLARRWIAERPSYLPVWRSAGAGSAVTGLAWSPFGQVLGASFADGAVRIWDLAGDQDVFLCQPGGAALRALVLSPDGGLWVAGGADGRIRRWDAGSNAELEPLAGHAAAVTSVAFSPDGRWLASAAQDGSVRLSNVAEGAPGLDLPGRSSPCRAVAFSPENAALACAWADGAITVWEVSTGAERFALEEPGAVFLGLAFRPDGRLLAAATDDGSVRLWDAAGGERRHVLSGASVARDRAAPSDLSDASVAFRPDGTLLASASASGATRLWSLGENRDPKVLATLAGGPAQAFAPDGLLLAEGMADGTVRLWDVSGQTAAADQGPDLCGYFRDGWYRFDEDQEVLWHTGPEAPATAFFLPNLRPASLAGIWRDPALDDPRRWGRVFERLLAARDWAGALLLVEQLRASGNGSAEAARLATALASEARQAQSAYAWNLARWRLEQLRRLGGDLPAEVEAGIRRVEADMISPEAPRNFTNAEGMDLIWCPPGRFLMGSPKSEKDRNAGETRHEVTLTRGFWLARTQVTQELWQNIMGNNPSYHSSSGLQAPVEQVSWNEALAFCGKLTARERAKGALPEGWEYSLPTEAQWEYACRAGSTKTYCFGDKEEKLGDYAWYSFNSGGKTHPVGQKKPNAWGLYDMHGNVWEWCLDWYSDNPKGAVTDPTGAPSGSSRVYRGGGWGSDAWSCRSAYRNGGNPGSRNDGQGFRAAVVPIPSSPGRQEANGANE